MDLRAGTAVLLLVLLCGGSEGLQNITVEPGQNVTLTCEAPQNLTVLVAEWRRTNLGEKYLFVFRQNHLVEGVHQQFRNRVFLPEGARGERRGVSVVVRNVTAEDSGTYLCQIKQSRTTNRTIITPDRMISKICLSVVPPGDKVRKEDEEGSRTRLTQLIVAVVVGVVGVVVGMLIVVVVYLIVKRQNTNNNPPDHGNHQQTSGEGIPLNGVSPANRSSGA